jgi:hypothetical protein
MKNNLQREFAVKLSPQAKKEKKASTSELKIPMRRHGGKKFVTSGTS